MTAWQSWRFQLTDVANNERDDVIYDTQTGLTWNRNARLPTLITGDGWHGAGTIAREQLAEFISILNANSIGGFNDWRYPTIEELKDLWDAGAANPSSDFVGMYIDEKYWSATYSAEKCSNGDCWKPIWCLYFWTGSPLESINRVDYPAIPVRG
jgi:hypothetical protein